MSKIHCSLFFKKKLNFLKIFLKNIRQYLNLRLFIFHIFKFNAFLLFLFNGLEAPFQKKFENIS